MRLSAEQFPNSETAQRMLSRVSPVYDQSYVAKWLFEVMGEELDNAKEHYEELRMQAFAETATWAMGYWEERYGLETDERLDLEMRRARVIAKRDTRVPMNPARVERILGEMSGRNFLVTENAAPYVFQVDMLDGGNEVDYRRLYKLLNNIKPSHQSYLFNTLLDVKQFHNKNCFEFRDLCYGFAFRNFGGFIVFDGDERFHGAVFFDQRLLKGLAFPQFRVALTAMNQLSTAEGVGYCVCVCNLGSFGFYDMAIPAEINHKTTSGMPDFQFTAENQHRCGLSGHLIKDSMRYMDGTCRFDGDVLFDADYIEEKI